MPFNDELFEKITYFDPAKICEENGYSVILSRFEDIREVTTALNVQIDNIAIKKEWFQLSRADNLDGLNDLEFDEWGKEVLSMPNSNVDSERTFSTFPDILNKKKKWTFFTKF